MISSLALFFRLVFDGFDELHLTALTP